MTPLNPLSMLLISMLLVEDPVLPTRGQGPDSEEARVERSLEVMGTRLVLEIVADDRGQALAASEVAFEAVRRAETRLSTWSKDSELALVNALEPGTTLQISGQLRRELRAAFDWRERTKGAFDPTVGGLIDLWDLRGVGRIPSDEEIATCLHSVGDEAFALGLPHQISRRLAGARLEEGGFGKGAALDLALAELRALGIEQARLDLGGQSILLGIQPLTLAVADPDQRERSVLAIELESGSIASSGNSERRRVVNGRRLGHLLDPRSGRPAPDFGALSVWAPEAFDADCLSTALYVMGPEAALAFAARTPDVELIVLERRPNGLLARLTEGWRGRVNSLDPKLSIEWYPNPSTIQSVPE